MIFHLSKLWKAKFSILYDVIFLVRLQGKFEIGHSWEYITHKNLTVRKIMEAMRTTYAKKQDSVSTRLKQNKTQTITEHTRVCEREAHIVCERFYFAKSFDELSGKGAFEMRHLFLYFFMLVRISEFLYENFSPTCAWGTHFLKS